MGGRKSKFWDGLTVSVQLLRQDGRKLTPAERDATAPLVGRMTVGPSNDPAANLLAATLFSLDKSRTVVAPLRKPLLDPRIVHMDERGIVLRGFEIDADSSGVTEYAQAWLVKPIP